MRLFQSTEYDEEDKEADESYATIDKYFLVISYMSTRRAKQREEHIKVEEEKLKKRNPQAKDAMKDIMKEISSMSRQDWLNIPDSKNTHFKRVCSNNEAQKRREVYSSSGHPDCRSTSAKYIVKCP